MNLGVLPATLPTAVCTKIARLVRNFPSGPVPVDHLKAVFAAGAALFQSDELALHAPRLGVRRRPHNHRCDRATTSGSAGARRA